MGAVTDIAAIAADVPWPDHEAEQTAREQREGRGHLGQLDDLAEWLAGTQGGYPPADPKRVRALIVAADHGIAAADVSASAPEATARWVAEVADGGSVVNSVAELAAAT